MSYQAIITKVSLRPHPKADRLMLADVVDHQLVCAKDTYTDGDIVIFFPEGGQLSHEVCHNNNLYRENKGTNKDPGIYGYFESSRRVRAIKLRGQKSEGFMLSLDCLAFTGADLSTLRPGMLLDELEGVALCNRYETRATREARQKAGGTRRKDIPEFAKVGDTDKFRYMANAIPAGAVITLSEKVHGTSGRTGKLAIVELEDVPENWLQKAWRQLLRKRTPRRTTYNHKYVSGTRRTICCEGPQEPQLRPDGTEIPLGYRQLIHNSLLGCLRLGETVYYEIAVCNDEGTPDFRHTVPKDDIAKATRKAYGDKMLYKYGVEPGAYGIWIYRITMQNEQSDSVQLSWNQMTRRAGELGIPTVPLLDQFVYSGDLDGLRARIAAEADGPSTLDSTHIREGVGIHIDSPRMLRVLKYKGFVFCHLEGIAKNDENYVDAEEIA